MFHSAGKLGRENSDGGGYDLRGFHFEVLCCDVFFLFFPPFSSFVSQMKE